MNRAFLPLALATALALPATAALAQGRTGVVRIGINDSLSGALVGFGTPPVAAIRLAISEINQKGFVVGDTTYRLQAVEVDNRSEGAACGLTLRATKPLAPAFCSETARITSGAVPCGHRK